MDENPDNYTSRSASPEDRLRRLLKYLRLLEFAVILIFLVPSAFIIRELYIKGCERHWQAFIQPGAVWWIIWRYLMALYLGGLFRLFGHIDTWLGWSNPHSVAGGMKRWESPTGVWTCISSMSWQHVGLYGVLCLSPILLLPWSEHPATDRAYYVMLGTIFLPVAMALPFFAVSVAIARGAYDVRIDGKASIVSIPHEEYILLPEAIYRLFTTPPRVIPLSSVRAFSCTNSVYGTKTVGLADMIDPTLYFSLTNDENDTVVSYRRGFNLMNSARLVSLVAWLNESLQQARGMNSANEVDPPVAFALNPLLPDAAGQYLDGVPHKQLSERRHARFKSVRNLQLSSRYYSMLPAIGLWLLSGYLIATIFMLGIERHWHAFVPRNTFWMLVTLVVCIKFNGLSPVWACFRFLLGRAHSGPAAGLAWKETSGRLWVRFSSVAGLHLALYFVLLLSPFLLIFWWEPLSPQQVNMGGGAPWFSIFFLSIMMLRVLLSILSIARGVYDIIVDFEEGTVTFPCFLSNGKFYRRFIYGPECCTVPLHDVRYFEAAPFPGCIAIPYLMIVLNDGKRFSIHGYYAYYGQEQIDTYALADWLNQKLGLEPGSGRGPDRDNDDDLPRRPAPRRTVDSDACLV